MRSTWTNKEHQETVKLYVQLSKISEIMTVINRRQINAPQNTQKTRRPTTIQHWHSTPL